METDRIVRNFLSEKQHTRLSPPTNRQVSHGDSFDMDSAYLNLNTTLESNVEIIRTKLQHNKILREGNNAIR